VQIGHFHVIITNLLYLL